MRVYEELFIVKPDASEEDIDSLTAQLEGVVTQAGGAVDKIDKWGVRRLAYRVAKQSEGYYVLIQFSAGADAVKEVERRLRVADPVIKYLTVRIDEKLKWLEKRKRAREKRAARRPPPPVAPAAPQPEAAPVPGTPAVETPAAAEGE